MPVYRRRQAQWYASEANVFGIPCRTTFSNKGTYTENKCKWVNYNLKLANRYEMKRGRGRGRGVWQLTYRSIFAESSRQVLLAVFFYQNLEKTSDHRTDLLNYVFHLRLNHQHMILNNAMVYQKVNRHFSYLKKRTNPMYKTNTRERD